MSWQKKDDNFHDSPKVVAASLSYAELGMYDYAVGYSHRHLTDGLVPRDQLIYRVSWETKQNFQASVAAAECLLQRLLDVCFFAERPDGNIQIVGYLDNYESKADVEEARERLSEIRAEAGRRGGIASGQSKREASSKANVQSKKAEASPQRSEPNLTDPNLTSPHRGESPQSSPPTPEKSDAYTRARATGPAPTPEPEPRAPTPATVPVRLVSPVPEAMSLSSVVFSQGVGRRMKIDGWSDEIAKATEAIACMLDETAFRIDDLSEYSQAIALLDRNALLVREDVQKAKKFLGDLIARSEGGAAQ